SEHPNKCPGPREVFSEHDKHTLVHIANTNHGALLAIITNELNLQLRTILTNRTTQKYLHDLVNEKYYKECVNLNVKFGSGFVMFWKCFSWWGVGPLVEVKGNINLDSYINVLANYFIPWANSLLEKYLNKIELIFQQDLASVHTSEYSE
ncbi:37772_t:CDS:2, partial [Gigaspora margarita]